MSQTTASADAETRSAMAALSADVQASLALNRALLQAVAAMSPTANAAAERALDGEMDLARKTSAPQRVVDAIEDARRRVQETPDDMELMSALEYALVAAADALPNISDLEAAEIASLARG